MILVKLVLCACLAMCASAGAAEMSLDDGECADMLRLGVITPDNPVPCGRLRRVNFEFMDFEGKIGTGNIVVLDAVAAQVDELFKELRAREFPIGKSMVMGNYEGDDRASMADNNTSGFNGRATTGESSWSKHASGAAIDINPLENPYISIDIGGEAHVLPPASAHEYVNRIRVRPGKKIRPGLAEAVADVFAAHGFLTWGGEWDFPIDYQHFEIGSRPFVEELARLPPDLARDEFESYAKRYRDCFALSAATEPDQRRISCVEAVRK